MRSLIRPLPASCTHHLLMLQVFAHPNPMSCDHAKYPSLVLACQASHVKLISPLTILLCSSNTFLIEGVWLMICTFSRSLNAFIWVLNNWMMRWRVSFWRRCLSPRVARSDVHHFPELRVVERLNRLIHRVKELYKSINFVPDLSLSTIRLQLRETSRRCTEVALASGLTALKWSSTDDCRRVVSANDFRRSCISFGNVSPIFGTLWQKLNLSRLYARSIKHTAWWPHRHLIDNSSSLLRAQIGAISNKDENSSPGLKKEYVLVTIACNPTLISTRNPWRFLKKWLISAVGWDLINTFGMLESDLSMSWTGMSRCIPASLTLSSPRICKRHAM